MNTTRIMGRKKLDRERINITLPTLMPEALTSAAAEYGWDRSRLIEELCRAFLKKRDREKGREGGGRGKPIK